jgi:hypothetical protein
MEKGGREMQTKGEMNRTVMDYVDAYDHNVPTGRFHIASNQEVKTFESLSQLLIKINDTLDMEKFPQAYAELRRFQDPQKIAEPVQDVPKYQSGAVATFAVRILFRQNASWQGSVTWVEGRQEACFRSVLELIVLMDNALGYS